MHSDYYSESSGISLSHASEIVIPNGGLMKDKLYNNASIYNDFGKHKQKKLTYQQGQTRQSPTPSFPRIESNSKALVKDDCKKSDFRLPSIPMMHISSQRNLPPTVGKYDRRPKVVPELNLPSPVPPRSPSPPPPLHLFLKEQYLKYRNQHSPGFSDIDLARIFDHYSISRYLLSRESTERDKSTNTLFPSTILPEIPQNNKQAKTKIKKKERYIWVPRLLSWIPEKQEKQMNYLHFGKKSTVTIKHLPICSKCHDFFHQNLNFDLRNLAPKLCPRYLQHHEHKTEDSSKKPKPRTVSLQKKPHTIPKDPFSSKSKRNFKRPWLKPVHPIAGKTPNSAFGVNYPLSNELGSPLWMMDNSTMTEDILSDILSLYTSVPSHSPIPNEMKPELYRKKKKKNVVTVDKGCDVISPTISVSLSQTPSSYAVSTTKDLKQDLEEVDDFAKKDDDLHTTMKRKTNLDKIKTFNEIINEDDKDDESTNNKSELSSKSEDKQLDTIVKTLNKSESKMLELSEHDFLDADVLTESKEEELTGGPKILLPLPQYIPSKDPLHYNDSQSSKLPSNISKIKPGVVVPVPEYQERPGSSRSSKSNRTRLSLHTPLSQKSSRRRGKILRDKTFAEDFLRAQRAEERRKRAKDKFEEIKNSRKIPPTKIDSHQTTPEEDKFLDNLTILSKSQLEMFRRAFNTYDIDEDGYLDTEELHLAVQKILPQQSVANCKLNHIFRLLELLNYDIKKEKLDFKHFTIISSMAQKIAALDDFMKGLIDRFDLLALDSRMWKARQFFDYFVDDHEQQTISMENLWIELKAGGIGERHEKEIRNSLKHLPHLDILDFMTYLPLFTLTHSHAVNFPLCDDRVT